MANGLDQIAKKYHPYGEQRALPTVATVRLGINVAACDKLPLAIVVGDTAGDRDLMSRQLAHLAWSHEMIGKLTYTSGSRNELRNIHGAQISRGYLFVLPDEFGTKGSVVAQLSPSASQGELKAAMEAAINRNHPSNIDHRDHIRLGKQQGIHWDTAIPVTDPHSPEAQQISTGRARGWGAQNDNQDDGPPMGPPPGGRMGFGPPGMNQRGGSSQRRSPLWGVQDDQDGSPVGPPPGGGPGFGPPGMGQNGPPMGPPPGGGQGFGPPGMGQNGPPMGPPPGGGPRFGPPGMGQNGPPQGPPPGGNPGFAPQGMGQNGPAMGPGSATWGTQNSDQDGSPQGAPRGRSPAWGRQGSDQN